MTDIQRQCAGGEDCCRAGGSRDVATIDGNVANNSCVSGQGRCASNCKGSTNGCSTRDCRRIVDRGRSSSSANPDRRSRAAEVQGRGVIGEYRSDSRGGGSDITAIDGEVAHVGCIACHIQVVFKCHTRRRPKRAVDIQFGRGGGESDSDAVIGIVDGQGGV